ncbi:MAG TPA: hypothetical protein VMT63_09625 [Bacteroidales bacterium]|nr:hypothetical protein [Bacteroidales bacterium]
MEELKDISKQNPFRVPEGYFENLNSRIVGKAMGEVQNPDPGKRTIVRNLRIYILAAASVAILAVAGYAVFHFPGYEKKDIYTSENIIVNNNSLDVNDIDIETLENNVIAREDYFPMPHVSRNDLLDYLESEEVSIFDIYEQL